MCGICGIVDFAAAPTREELERMAAALVHRGPDDSGFEEMGAAAFGFRRLSIIDVAGSHQPIWNEDRTLCLVFNGEIYNFRALRAALAKRGHRFSTQGDGETILHLYEEHGDDAVLETNGMFAFALWDLRRQRLLLGRDRLGIKPLYYAHVGRRVLFGSEAKALLAVEGVARRADHAALVAYMNHGSIPGDASALEGVRRVLPGHLLIFDASGLRARQYWDLDLSPERKRERDPAALVDEVEALLREAVDLQMISDVPLGALLSGGVDSSLISALMAQLSPHPVEAFSIGYGAGGEFMNELDWARRVAERWGMRHHPLVVEPDDLLRDFERVVWHLDEPCGDPAAFLTLALSDFSRRRVTVVLSGLGADELFGGYRRYLGLRWQERWLALPRFLREGIARPLLERLPETRTDRFGNWARLAKKLVAGADADPRRAWANTVSYLPAYDGPMFGGAFESVRRESYTSEAFEALWSRVAAFPDPVDRATYLDVKTYMVDQLLLLQDKMSMAASLEARVPFLDHRLVELAATIPTETKLAGGRLKAVLKSVAERHVPHECVHRAKQGFAAPLERWLRGPLRERVLDLLSAKRVRDRGVFQVEFVEWMKREFFERGRDLSLQLYQALVLETWMNLYLDARR